MVNRIFVLLFLLTTQVSAQEERTLEIQCKEMVKLLEDINSKVQEDKLITLDSCEESHETALFGIIKKNFRSKVVLSTKDGLCRDPKFVEKKPTDLKDGAHLGVDYERKVNALHAFGFRRGDLGSSGGLEGTYLRELHYPICEE